MTPERWHELWSVVNSNEPDVGAIREAAREALLEVDRAVDPNEPRDAVIVPVGFMKAVYRRTDKLREALRSLGSHYPDGGFCFCEMAIGNPMVSEHSDACKRIRSLLGKHEGGR